MSAGRKSISDNKHWNTPPSMVESVKEVFGGSIKLDPCSNSTSLVGAETEYVLPSQDGLEESWDYATIYVNPPYGSDPVRKTRIIHWFEKMEEAHKAGSEVVALVPVAPNTLHWKKHVFPSATAICFLYQARFRFYRAGVEDIKGAPMACAIIYWGNKPEKFGDVFSSHGAVVFLADARIPLA